MNSKNKYKKNKIVVEDLLTQIKLHPLILNEHIIDVLPSGKTLKLLDSDLISIENSNEQTDKQFDGLKTTVFDKDQWKQKNAVLSEKVFLSSDKFPLETLNKKCDGLKNVFFEKDQCEHKNDQGTKLYCYKHFKWLFSQNTVEKTETKKKFLKAKILNKHSISFEDFMRENFYSFENCFGKNDSLFNKIVEFCEWAKIEFDCSEEELDPITLIKIFSVNYENEPLMFMKLDLKEVDDQSMLENVLKNFPNSEKSTKKILNLKNSKKKNFTEFKFTTNKK